MKVNPDAAGFDADRLQLIDEHLRRSYIDPQKIAGCQVVVARRGQIAHHRSLGSMDLERGRPVLDDTIWRLYSMTKPITGVALLEPLRAGPVPAHRPDPPVPARVPRHEGRRSGSTTAPAAWSTPSGRSPCATP